MDFLVPNLRAFAIDIFFSSNISLDPQQPCIYNRKRVGWSSILVVFLQFFFSDITYTPWIYTFLFGYNRLGLLYCVG